MKRTKLVILYILSLGGGCVGYLLRRIAQSGAQGGLEYWINPMLGFAAAVALAGAMILVIGKVEPDGTCRGSFPASRIGALGTWGAAALLFFHAFSTLLERPDRLTMLVELVGVICAIALVFTGWCRCTGRRPNFLYHALVCVYFALHMVSSYRSWSAEPQMLTYMYQLMALAAVAIAAYYRCCFDANHGNRQMYLRFSFPAVMLCIVAAADGSKLLYLAAALWLGTNPCECAGHSDHAA